MRGRFVRLSLFVFKGIDHLGGNILIKVPATIDIERLYPVTDRKDGQVSSFGRSQEQMVNLITLEHHMSELRMARFPVTSRVEIAVAPGKDYTIHTPYQFTDVFRIRNKWHENRYGTGLLKRFAVIPTKIKVRNIRIDSGGNANERSLQGAQPSELD